MFRELYGELGPLFRLQDVKTTNIPFKLLTRLTVNILIGSAILISFRDIFGDPINCSVSDSDKDLKQIIELKCWIEGVYLNRELLEAGRIGKTVSRWGVGPVKNYKGAEFIRQSYYQWVVPVLLLQALLFYLPRALWRRFERGVMVQLIGTSALPLIEAEWIEKRNKIQRYLADLPKKYHRSYGVSYLACEMFAYVTLLLNMLLMHVVFNDFWSTYQPAIGALLQQNSTSFSQHSSRLFPTQAKCFYHDFGPSGSAQERDALCILPQNTVNEKVFAFLYIWLLAMLFVCFISLLFHLAMLTSKWLRFLDLRRMSNCADNRKDSTFFYSYSDFGYWFTLQIIHNNLHSFLFSDLMEHMMKPKEKFEEVLQAHEVDQAPKCLQAERV